jgi:hypothetical protein
MSQLLKPIPINKYNFVRFYAFGTPTLSASYYNSGIHNGRLFRWRGISPALPILTGDILKFYTNFTEPKLVSGDEFKLIDSSNNIISNNSTYNLTVSAIDGTNNYILTLSLLSNPDVDGQSLRVAIINGSTIKYVSNCFEAYSYQEKYLRGTHIISFAHDNDIYGYDFTQIEDEDDYYTIRVASNLIGVSYSSEDSVYKSATTGKSRKTRSIIDRVLQLETYYNDVDFHDAFNICVHLKKFFVNGDKFVKQDGYEIGFNNQFNLSKGTINLIDDNYSIRVDRCINN